MDILLQGLLLSVLIAICIQDFKQRSVYAFLFVLGGLLLGYFHFIKVPSIVFAKTAFINVTIICSIVLILNLYAIFKLKLKFNDTFGLGDTLFFFALAIGFPTATFLVLFSCASIFALLVFMGLKKKLTTQTVPLAGLQALFISLVWVLNLIHPMVNLYLI